MTKSPKPIRVLSNAREMIDAVVSRGALSAAELAEVTGMPRPSVYRLAAGLVAVDLLEVDSTGAYRISLRWLHLADAALAGMSEWTGVAEVLEGLVSATGLTAFLSVPRDGEALCIRWVPGRGIGVLALRPGRSLPLNAGGAGRALLAAGTDQQVDEYLKAAPFTALTPKTLTAEGELRADVELTRRQGFCTSNEDVTLGIGAVGVALGAASGGSLGAISLGGLVDDVIPNADQLGELLVETAASISLTQ